MNRIKEEKMSRKYGIATFSPTLDDKEYDGLFIRSDEMAKIAALLVGKPLLLEHDEKKRIGVVCHAWKGKNGSGKVLFEIDTSCDLGKKVHAAIKSRELKDVSLGHIAKLDSSTLKVVDKKPVELSICEEGARPQTHIIAIQASKLKRGNADTSTECGYILKSGASLKQSNATMENPQETTTTTPAPVEDTAAAPAETTETNINEVEQLVNELKEARAKIDSLSAENANLDQLGKRKRADAIPDIKKFIDALLKQYPDIKYNEAAYDTMLNGLKNSSTATPVVELLQCAAKKHFSSVAEQEKTLNELKEARAKVDQMNEAVASSKRMRFSEPSDRHVEVKATASSSKKKDGIASLPACNGSYWEQILNTKVTESAMETDKELLGWLHKPSN